MKNRIRRSLAPLASLWYQRRFILGGTREEYVLPQEVVESARSIAETISQLHSAGLPCGLSEHEIEALDSFRKRVLELEANIPFEDDTVSLTELIEANEAWDAVRAESRRCLEQLGISLLDWEGQQGITSKRGRS